MAVSYTHLGSDMTNNNGKIVEKVVLENKTLNNDDRVVVAEMVERQIN